MTQLNFYAIANEYSRWLPVFNSIINSFHYETAYAYDPVEAVKNDSPVLFKGVAEKGLDGVITGGIMSLLATLLGRVVKKKKNKESSQ